MTAAVRAFTKAAALVAAVWARTTTVMLAAVILLAVWVSPVMASEHHPTGIYEEFTDCPLATLARNCVFAMIDGGEVTVGHRTISVNRPIVVQGGFYTAPNDEELVFVGAEDGNTLSNTQLSVPGGLTGLITPMSLPPPLKTQFDNTIAGGLTGVTMTLQLAKPASAIYLSTENLLAEEEIALRLPLKVKLNNPFLGNNCYIGSPTHPLILNMTTGTTSPPAPNRPIKGSAGKFTQFHEFLLIRLSGAVLVDNSFAVPEATGCGENSASIIDRVLNTALGLPSPAGHNTAILNGTFNLANVKGVRESEE